MLNTIEQPTTAAPTGSRKPTTTSQDGKHEKFPRHVGLYRYIPTGNFYVKFKIKGTIKQASLETTDKVTAVRNLEAKRLELLKPLVEKKVVTVATGKALYEAEQDARHELADHSKEYNRYCVKAIFAIWKEEHGDNLEKRDPTTITKIDALLWGKKFSTTHSATFYNNSLNIFRAILKWAGVKHDDNPLMDVKRMGVKPKKLELPTIDQFNQILAHIETAGARDAKDRADFVRFLAFSGCRLSEAGQVLWKDVNFDKGTILVHCAKRRITSNESSTRLVPIVPAMEQFLKRLATAGAKPEDRVCKVVVCRKPLVRACLLLKIPTLTHHDFRHLFATFCMEANVDIPTISRWMGHSDGGGLVMKTYGHGRPEHSLRMAAQVTFGHQQIAPPAPVDIKSEKQIKELEEYEQLMEGQDEP